MKVGIEGGREARFEVQGPMSEVQSPKSKVQSPTSLRAGPGCALDGSLWGRP